MTVKELNDTICRILNEKKAEDITILEIGHLTIIADYMVIATARSTAQAKALAENLEDKLAKEQIEPLRVEGIREGRWVVLDYGSTIVHIFNDETRMLYCLDKLWADGTNLTKYEAE